MQARVAIDPALVRDFVAKSHGDLEQVKTLLEREPALVNVAWDWGGGDWETGLGAAAHVGNKDIAAFLLDRGARLDLFAAAMLGKIEIVEAVVRAFPGAHRVRGPHGITLLDHAKAGGEEARAVVELLQSLEDA